MLFDWSGQLPLGATPKACEAVEASANEKTLESRSDDEIPTQLGRGTRYLSLFR